jgi:hypothetical protein
MRFLKKLMKISQILYLWYNFVIPTTSEIIIQPVKKKDQWRNALHRYALQQKTLEN